jgi:hypothetical protein
MTDEERARGWLPRGADNEVGLERLRAQLAADFAVVRAEGRADALREAAEHCRQHRGLYTPGETAHGALGLEEEHFYVLLARIP